MPFPRFDNSTRTRPLNSGCTASMWARAQSRSFTRGRFPESNVRAIYIQSGVEREHTTTEVWRHVSGPRLQKNFDDAGCSSRSNLLDTADPRVACKFQFGVSLTFRLQYDHTDWPDGLHFLLADG